VNRAELRGEGYTIVRALFEPEEAEQIRQSVIDLLTELDGRGEAVVEEGTAGQALHPPADMLTYEPLRKVLLDQRLIAAVTELLGDTPAYWGESSVVVGSYGGARAWHTDAYNTPVSRGLAYPLVRCGLYLQDIAQYSGGLAVRPGSHAWPLSPYRPALVPMPITLVRSKPGDLVVWDMRLVHAGEVVRWRAAPRVGLPLSVQGRLSERRRLPEERGRVVMFPTFGLPGRDLDSYLDYQRGRDYMQDIWRASRFGPEVWAEAESAGLRLVRPVPEWGAVPAPAAS
jgi:ectoine hydroxylase-related dioxygenase (phytanoyl-CoA dioxygenase family)